MKTKIKIADNKETKRKYPYFGIYEKDLDHVVLFTAPKKGIVIHSEYRGCLSDYEVAPVGYESDNVDEKTFIPFYGKIIVKQD
jgi:hypothetical protein